MSGGILQKEARSITKNIALGEISGTSTRLEPRGETIRVFQSVTEATKHGARKKK